MKRRFHLAAPVSTGIARDALAQPAHLQADRGGLRLDQAIRRSAPGYALRDRADECGAAAGRQSPLDLIRRLICLVSPPEPPLRLPKTQVMCFVGAQP